MIIRSLFYVEVTSSDYNPDKDDLITITATAKDFNDNPVTGKSLTIKKNGVNLHTGTTDSNGNVTTTTSCGGGGTFNFSVKSWNCIVTVNPYPVGSIYISASDVSPASLFGGSWSKIEDKFLLSSGSSYSATYDANGFANKTGGSATHTLTTSQMPSHNHTPSNTSYKFVCSENGMDLIMSDGHKFQSTGSYYYMYTSTKKGVAELNTANAGGGQAHNNMPPYLVVNVWERTA